MSNNLISYTEKGLYCSIGNFYIDPHRSVEHALITHAHSDHARSGHKKYLAHKNSTPLLHSRISKKINLQTVEYGEVININGVRVSFYPAGHIIGSSQIKLEYRDQIWVITGDYKVIDDGISGKYEPVKCTHFVTETTFASPIYIWPDQEDIYNDINSWWKTNQQNKITSVILCYSIGKAQRVLHNLDKSIGQIYLDKYIQTINKSLIDFGIDIFEAEPLNVNNLKLGSMILATPTILKDRSFMNKLIPYSLAEVSGWMMLESIRRRRIVEKGFVLSDHVDWNGVNFAVNESSAEVIYTMHGYTDSYAKWLHNNGKKAYEIQDLGNEPRKAPQQLELF